MNPAFRARPKNRTKQVSAFPVGSALVISLAFLTLVTILVIGLFSIIRLERISTRNVFATTKARLLSDMAADHAQALIRESISTAESTVTDPVAANRKFWASQPGKITVFNADGRVDDEASRLLYSTNADPSAPRVNLNAAPFGGTHPIMADDGTGSAPEMAVSWINVLADPSTAPSATNPLIGRYAFWVDDESTKININTADGSAKSGDTSFGPGTPTEVNLQALKKTSGSLSAAEAALIAKQSGARHDIDVMGRPFNSNKEILRTDTLSPDVYDLNFQDITVYNRSPELNIFGEPKIYLTTAIPSLFSSLAVKNASTPLSFFVGPYADIDPHPSPKAIASSFYPKNVATGRALTWIYPSSGTGIANSQLPPYRYRSPGDSKDTDVRLPQFFRDDVREYVSAVTASQKHPTLGHPDGSMDYEMGMRIAQYLKGVNSQGHPIAWPRLPGSGAGSFDKKYTDRQIDDITAQILSLLKQTHTDHYYNHTLPYYFPTGFLSGKAVRGLSRAPRMTEVVVKISTVAGDPPMMRIQIVSEFYLPKQFGGSDLTFGDLDLWSVRINFYDWPTYTDEALTGSAPMGNYWADSLLHILDQDGQPAGVDLFGNNDDRPDPDQHKAALYHHPWALKDQNTPYDPETNPYMGTGGPTPTNPKFGRYSAFRVGDVFPGAKNDFKIWRKGDYLAVPTSNSARSYPMKSGTTSITIEGGLAVWLREVSQRPIEAIPIDSIFPWAPKLARDFTAEERQTFLEAVIPIPGSVDERTIPIPGVKVFHMQVADPLVNAFPADWEGTVLSDTNSAPITIAPGAFTSRQFYQDGQNTISNPSQGADPESIWWPEQNVSIPKSRRFPSSGYLQFIRTGVMPDPQDDSRPLRQQKGTPWRMLNFSPSTAASQQTRGGESLPDWLLLDLFTTPAVFQPLGQPLPAPIIQTWGGASAGRINPNAVLLPFNIARTKPLEALFKDVSVTRRYDSEGDPEETVVDESELAEAVTSYIQSLNRPLMLPGEISNVPAIAAHMHRDVDEDSQSRNDLVRKTVGNLTTRSNTFKVWVASEVIQKLRDNNDYANFESGDIIVGRNRMCYVIERYLDPGSDGVYGNAADPGPDGVLNTPDDPVTASDGAHPVMSYPLPYKYRIISVSQVE